MSRPITDYKALTFDCYGTLIDWEGGIWDALQPLILANGRDDVTRADGLAAFGEIEADQQAATPGMLYPDLLTVVHRRIAERWGMTTDASLDVAFGASVPFWPAFADSADALRRLARHYRLVILSNVDRAGFAASNARLGVRFDAVYTAEDVGSYKPDPRNFDYMTRHLAEDLGIAAADVLHTAQSMRHDHVPATAKGFATCWIDRQLLAEGGSWGATARVAEMPETTFRFRTLAEMADAVEAAG